MRHSQLCTIHTCIKHVLKESGCFTYFQVSGEPPSEGRVCKPEMSYINTEAYTRDAQIKSLLKSSVPDAMHRTEPRREILSGAGWRSSAQFDEHHIVIHASSFASLPLLTAAMEERYCCKVLELPAMWGDCRREVVDGTVLSAS